MIPTDIEKEYLFRKYYMVTSNMRLTATHCPRCGRLSSNTGTLVVTLVINSLLDRSAFYHQYSHTWLNYQVLIRHNNFSWQALIVLNERGAEDLLPMGVKWSRPKDPRSGAAPIFWNNCFLQQLIWGSFNLFISQSIWVDHEPWWRSG